MEQLHVALSAETRYIRWEWGKHDHWNSWYWICSPDGAQHDHTWLTWLVENMDVSLYKLDTDQNFADGAFEVRGCFRLFNCLPGIFMYVPGKPPSITEWGVKRPLPSSAVFTVHFLLYTLSSFTLLSFTLQFEGTYFLPDVFQVMPDMDHFDT